MKLGIDIGASAVKLALVRDGALIESRYLPGRPDIVWILNETGLDAKRLELIALTGVGAEGLDENTLPAPCRRVQELEAIGAGGRLLSGRDHAVVTSIGTGTAYISVCGGECRHLGGTGVGGGTLKGFASLLGLHGAQALLELASEGDLTKVDLTIGELFSGSETIDPRLTAANLAKVSQDAQKADWAAGLVNLVLQAIGSMALLACAAAGAPCVVVTGAVAMSERAKENFSNFQKIYDREFIIPPRAECATAYGAAMLV